MTRSELYALVWQEPMTKLAKRFRLSDVGRRKICTKHGIPTPPLGYWSKLAFGKKVTQPSLPSLRPGQSDRVDLTLIPTEHLSDEAAEELRQALDKEQPRTLGEHLKKRRLVPDLFQKQAAKRLGVSQHGYIG